MLPPNLHRWYVVVSQMTWIRSRINHKSDAEPGIPRQEFPRAKSKFLNVSQRHKKKMCHPGRCALARVRRVRKDIGILSPITQGVGREQSVGSPPRPYRIRSTTADMP